MSNLSHRTASMMTVVGIITIGSCNDDPTESGNLIPQRPYSIQIHAGDGQIGEAASALPIPLAVLVEDARNRPVAAAVVRWAAAAGGSVSDTATVTDASGIARVLLTLPDNAGEHRTHAWLAGSASSALKFITIAQVQGAVTLMEKPGDSGQSQSDSVRARLAPYRIQTIDHNNRPVAGVRIAWSLSGEGTLSDSVTHTNADGVAEVVHTLGSRPSFELVQAFVPGLVGSPVNFITHVRPGSPISLVASAGDGQIALINRMLPQPYVVSGFDAYGNPTSNLGVDWFITSGGGQIAPISAVSAHHTLGPVSGPQTVTARLIKSATPIEVTFTARAADALVNVGYGWYCYYYYQSFSPASVTIRPGGTVIWVWHPDCSGPHNVTFEDDPNPPVSSPTQSEGTLIRTFGLAPTTIRFRCTLHSSSFAEGEVGTVVVQ